MRVLIVGCGYVGLPLGGMLAKRGHEVHGLRRTDNVREAMNEAGIQPHIIDITKRGQLDALPGPFDWIVSTVSSGRGSVQEFRKVFVDGTRNLLEWLAGSPPHKFLFTSSTSVYGQTDGSWVDEDSPAEPTSETGQILLEAESLVRSEGGIVLRLSGIYGPERGHLYRQYLKGEATMIGDPGRWLNMIHRDDVAGGILAAMENAAPGSVLNITDNEPVTQLDFCRWLADHLGRPMPPKATASGKRGSTNKRVANRRAMEELSWSPQHPSWREGYTALMRAEGVD